MYRSGKETVKNILLFNILIYLFSPRNSPNLLNDQEVLCALGEIVFSLSPSRNDIQTVSNFCGVDSEMLASEKSIFENYDCGDPCQRKNAAVMVKTMH